MTDHRWLLVPVLVALSAPTYALGGCTKDTDCKGDRICVEEQCTDPVPQSPAAPGPSGVDPVDLRYAKERRGVAHRNLHGTWVLFGFQTAAVVSFGGWLTPLIGQGEPDDDTIGTFSSFGAVTLLNGLAGPIASIGGAEARRGLDRLGLPPVETGLRDPGLALYGVSMGFIAGTYGALAGLIAAERDCFGQYVDSAEALECEQQESTAQGVMVGVYTGSGLTGAITGLISTVLLQVDTARQRRALLDAIDDANAGRLGLVRPRPRLHGVRPWFEAGAEGPGGGIALTWSL